MKTIFFSTFFYSLFSLTLFAGTSAFPEKAPADSLARLIDKHYFLRKDLSHRWVGELYRIAGRHPEDPFIRAKAILYETSVVYAQGEHDRTLTVRIDSLLALEPKNPLSEVMLLYSNVLAHTGEGNYPEAFQYAVRMLEKSGTIDDRQLLFKLFNLMGTLYSYIKNYNRAEAYYEQAAAYISPEETEYSQLLNNRYRIAFLRGEIQEATRSFEQMIPALEAKRDTAALISFHLNLGACYSENRETGKAFQSFQTALELVNTTDNDKFKTAIYQNLGNYYYLVKEYGKSSQYLLKAKELAHKNNNPEQLSYILHSFATVFGAQNKIDSAYFYLKAYETLNNRLNDRARITEVYQSYVSVLIESSENKLKITENELALRKKQYALAILSAVAIIATIVFLLILLFQKKRSAQQKTRLREIENKDLSMRLQYQNELRKLQNEKLEDQLREINSYSLLLLNKNHLLQQILDTTAQYGGEKEQAGDIFRKIKTMVKNNQHTEKEWDDFILHFEKVHPRFFEKLLAKYPHLTKNDLKLCAYIRIGMSMKQIAQMLNIFPDSVKTNRYRLRKKFDLPEDENLDDFIRLA
ncbi:MAG: LuxR C-terminal-related transcriptional regulator [Dysgonamonadaceae bacterium]|jgi:tetratricopeptide (TPR) repeat protein|nr:LuxR C-terminal-related transcriptional regulator [Dysgonamonadaceae bacterium]